MFIFNLKLNKNFLSKGFITISLIVIFAIIGFSVYAIFFKNNIETIKPDIIADDIFQINETNYTNILKAANENIDSYVGLKVQVTGYVYRLLNFKENQFVIARDMQFSNTSQTLIVGFLCNYKKAMDFSDGTWVTIVGKIKKGDYNGDIAMLDIISIEKTSEPQNPIVNPPDNTYIPTANMF